jgi:hypothetical protein
VRQPAIRQLLVRVQIMMNATGVHGKRSSLERSLDKLIFCVFMLLAVICLIDAIGSSKWVNKVRSKFESMHQSIAELRDTQSKLAHSQLNLD